MTTTLRDRMVEIVSAVPGMNGKAKKTAHGIASVWTAVSGDIRRSNLLKGLVRGTGCEEAVISALEKNADDLNNLAALEANPSGGVLPTEVSKTETGSGPKEKKTMNANELTGPATVAELVAKIATDFPGGVSASFKKEVKRYLRDHFVIDAEALATFDAMPLVPAGTKMNGATRAAEEVEEWAKAHPATAPASQPPQPIVPPVDPAQAGAATVNGGSGSDTTNNGDPATGAATTKTTKETGLALPFLRFSYIMAPQLEAMLRLACRVVWAPNGGLLVSEMAMFLGLLERLYKRQESEEKWPLFKEAVIKLIVSENAHTTQDGPARKVLVYAGAFIAQYPWAVAILRRVSFYDLRDQKVRQNINWPNGIPLFPYITDDQMQRCNMAARFLHDKEQFELYLDEFNVAEAARLKHAEALKAKIAEGEQQRKDEVRNYLTLAIIEQGEVMTTEADEAIKKEYGRLKEKLGGVKARRVALMGLYTSFLYTGPNARRGFNPPTWAILLGASGFPDTEYDVCMKLLEVIPRAVAGDNVDDNTEVMKLVGNAARNPHLLLQLTDPASIVSMSDTLNKAGAAKLPRVNLSIVYDDLDDEWKGVLAKLPK